MWLFPNQTSRPWRGGSKHVKMETNSQYEKSYLLNPLRGLKFTDALELLRDGKTKVTRDFWDGLGYYLIRLNISQTAGETFSPEALGDHYESVQHLRFNPKICSVSVNDTESYDAGFYLVTPKSIQVFIPSPNDMLTSDWKVC